MRSDNAAAMIRTESTGIVGHPTGFRTCQTLVASKYHDLSKFDRLGWTLLWLVGMRTLGRVIAE